MTTKRYEARVPCSGAFFSRAASAPRSSRTRCAVRHGVLLAASSSVALATHVRAAAPDNYTAGTGNWSTGSNWSLGVKPQAGDLVTLAPTVPFSTITLDVSATNLAQLTIDVSTGNKVTLFQAANTLSVSSFEVVGFNGSGAVNQTGGVHSIDGPLYFGFAPGSSGSLALGGGSLALNFSDEAVGYSGTASVVQSGGTHTIGGSLQLGTNLNASGTFNLSNGALSINGSGEIIGDAGTGKFIQSGGTHNVSVALYLGYAGGGVGSYSMTNGTLAILGDELVGQSGLGTFNQSGGNHSVSQSINIAAQPLSTGAMSLTGGATSAFNVFVGGTSAGVGGAGSISINGGSLTVLNQLQLLNAGSTLTFSSGNLAVGYLDLTGNPGGFQWNGGTLGITGANGLFVGQGGLLGSSLAIPGNKGLSVTATLAIAKTASLSGNGGFIGAGAVANDGAINISAGTVFLGSVTGTGTLTAGGAGPVSVNADSLTQSNVTIGSGALLNVGSPAIVLPAASPAGAGPVATLLNVSGALNINGSSTMALLPTANAGLHSGTQNNSVHQLAIGPNGLLDVQNHMLLIDNTYSNTAVGGTQTSAGGTPYGAIQTYVNNAYNLNGSPNPGLVGDYNGRGGITSGVAKASYAGGAIGAVSLVSYSGAQQDGLNPTGIEGLVLGPNANSGAGTGIPLSKTLVRATATGDLNGDGVVDDFDITLFSSYGLYKGDGTGPHTNLGPQVGDFNHDGVVDDTDILIFSSAGNYLHGTYPAAGGGSSKAGATPKLTASPSAALNPASGTFSFNYDPATGDVTLKYNGFTGAAAHPFIPGTSTLSVIDILSANGAAFPLDASKLDALITQELPTGAKTPPTHIVLNSAATPPVILDGADLGRILPAGLDPVALAADLTLKINYTGSSSLNFTAGLATSGVPEPTTLSLLALGGMGLMGRRRRRVR